MVTVSEGERHVPRDRHAQARDMAEALLREVGAQERGEQRLYSMWRVKVCPWAIPWRR